MKSFEYTGNRYARHTDKQVLEAEFAKENNCKFLQ